MKIAILGATSEEITPLLETFKNYTKIEHANNTYYLANYKDREFILAYSRIGKVSFALNASVMIEKSGVQALLFTGVASTSNPGLEIGGPLYATKLARYDLDITAFGHPLGSVPGNEILIKTDDKLNDLALEVAKKLNIKPRAGIIAAGNEFICDKAKKVKIRGIFNTDACGMENASVALACDTLKVPCSILRAISGEVGEEARFDFNEFVINLAKIPANFVFKTYEKL